MKRKDHNQTHERPTRRARERARTLEFNARRKQKHATRDAWNVARASKDRRPR